MGLGALEQAVPALGRRVRGWPLGVWAIVAAVLCGLAGVGVFLDHLSFPTRPSTCACTTAVGPYLEPWNNSSSPDGTTHYANFTAEAGNPGTSYSIVNVTVYNSTGWPVYPRATAVCTTPSPGFRACTAAPAGWYVALVSSNSGAWLDSFPLNNRTGGWSDGVPTLLAGEVVSFVSPTRLTGTADTACLSVEEEAGSVVPPGPTSTSGGGTWGAVGPQHPTTAYISCNGGSFG